MLDNSTLADVLIKAVKARLHDLLTRDKVRCETTQSCLDECHGGDVDATAPSHADAGHRSWPTAATVQVLTDDDLPEYAPTRARSLVTSLQAIGNPLKALQQVRQNVCSSSMSGPTQTGQPTRCRGRPGLENAPGGGGGSGCVGNLARLGVSAPLRIDGRASGARASVAECARR